MKTLIIGGGAAGLMAAAAIRENGPDCEIALVDKNSGLGKKVLISGGGRCNVTTGVRDIRTVLSKYPRGGKFLNSAMRRFSPEAVRAWFESRGVPLYIEGDLRVFPRSNDGRDVVRVFERLLDAPNVRLMLNREVASVERGEKGFKVRLKGGETLDADRVIITTGGQAYRRTGSTGDGYAFAEALGHRITPLAPSLNSFFTRETWPKEVAGLSFEKVQLRTRRDKKHETVGPILFTHRGVTGPAVFAMSSLTAYERYDAEHPMALTIDLFPDESADGLRGRLDSAMRESPKKSLVNVLDFFTAKSLAAVLCRELRIDGEASAGGVSKKDIARIAGWFKGAPLNVVGRDAGDEFVTAGGVDLKEVDPSTMESKIVPGLFFAGEVLDIDGFTGGFNLQSAWATGRAAGTKAAEKV